MNRLVLASLLLGSLFQASRGNCASESTQSSVRSGVSPGQSASVSLPEPRPAPGEPGISWEPFAAPGARGRDAEGIDSSLATEALARWNVGGSGDVSYLSNRTGFHPGTRVIVEIEPSKEPRAQRELPAMTRRYLAAFRNFGYWPYRMCFETSARDAASAGGDAWIRVRTTGRGRVLSAKLIKSNLDQKPIAACICQATRSLDLHRPNLPSATFVLRVRVFPGDAPLPPAVSANDSPWINLASHRGAFELIRESVEPCIREGLRRDAKLWGRFALRVQVDKDGRVVNASENGSHFPDRSAVACSTSAALRLRFPEMSQAGSLDVALRVGSLPQPIAVSDPREQASTVTSQPNQPKAPDSKFSR